MHDLKWIRENPTQFDVAMARRGLSALSSSILEADEARRTHIEALQQAQARRNAASKEIGKAKAQKDEEAAAALMKEVADIKGFIQSGEDKERALSDQLDDLLAGLPNIMADDVPDGADETENLEMHRRGTPPSFAFKAKDHTELGESLGQMDFETAALISGARFVFLKADIARLERALAQFMLDTHTQENGYTEIVAPALVNSPAMFGTGQLPKFSEDLFQTTDERWLIPTSEVPLTNLVREKILNEEELPLRFASYTQCFRAEAGSAGRDTRGMIRQHQFSKVEMVSIVAEEASDDEQQRMLSCAEGILDKLELAYRTVKLCSGDTGFGARRTFDIEVWLPGQDAYREISSCSTCGDFQARRMQARYRTPQDKTPKFVHTLNGSGLAVGRTLIAVLENFQNGDGSITIPPVLQPYMGGKIKIEASS